MSPRKHVLVISLPLAGHSDPALELARKIGEHVVVTFATSGYLVDELMKRPEFAPTLGHHWSFYKLNDGKKPDFNDPKLPRILFSTVNPLVTELVKGVRVVGEQANPVNACLIQPIDAVIADLFFAAALEAGFKRQIPIYLLNMPSFGFMRWLMTLSDDTPTAPLAVAPDLVRLQKAGESPQVISDIVKHSFLPVRKFMPYATGILQNSFFSVDQEGLELVQADLELGKIPQYFVGPLIPPDEPTMAKDSTDASIQKWLTAQSSRSVIYVSFGSMTVPKDEQVFQIANALLLLDQPFIWSLKEQAHHNLPEEIRNKMATQFEPNSQFLILPWAPQKAILANPAIGVIVSHCGWNGTLESILNGIPVVAWPMFAEQLINAEWLVERGIAVLIPGTGKRLGRIVPANEVVEAVEKVAGLRDGTSEFRTAAEYWAKEAKSAVLPNGSSTKDVERLLALL